MLAVTVSAPIAAFAEESRLLRPGYVLQTELSGQGSLDVVFESGFGQGADAWKAVVAELGEGCHCMAYARAGLGASGTDDKSLLDMLPPALMV